MNVCTKCGNSGYLVNGELCDCGITSKPVEDGKECITIPRQYRNIRFDKSLIPDVTGSGHYKNFLYKLYEDITSYKFEERNMLIGSPVKSSKTVFAYCCIQFLFKRDIPTFPLMDILEIKSIMYDIDNGKKSVILEGLDAVQMNVYSAPYLFVRITSQLDYSVFDAIATLLDRRTRRGNSTIFLFNGSWSNLAKADIAQKFVPYLGDGSFGTVEDKSFWRKGATE